MRSISKRIEYSDELALKICEGISNSHFGIRYLCKHNPDWPCQTTIYEWLHKYPFFAEQYALARELQSEGLVSDMIEIASNESRDILVDENGKTQTNHAAIQRDRLKIDSIKWIASKLIPKKYGEPKQSQTDIDAITEFRVEDK